jgi:TATA-box binding protein (TBP) (component of TFIID and TFIIIB)
MQLRIVNSVWRGTLDVHVNLAQLAKQVGGLSKVIKVKHQTQQPEQLIIKFNDSSTMLVFKTGKFRIMGRGDDIDKHFNIFSVTCLHQDNYPDIVLQTLTAAFAYPHHVNLNKLSQLIECHYHPELFPAVQIRRYKPIHVNVFESGKVTITGLKDFDAAIAIEAELHLIIHLNNVI